MKKIAVLLLFAAAAYVGAAYIFGGQIRERYFLALEENGGGIVSMSNQEYRRGLFTSEASTVVEVVSPGAAQDGSGQSQVSRFIVHHAFHHGPFPVVGGRPVTTPMLAVVDSSLEPSVDGGPLAELFTKVPELAGSTADVRVAFDGKVDAVFRIPAFSRDNDGTTVSWGGLNATAVYDPSTGRVRGDLAAAGLNARSARGGLEIGGLSSHFDLLEALPLVYVGQVDAVLPSMTFADRDGGELRLQGLRTASDSNCDGELVRYRQSMTLERLELEGVAYGPIVCDLETKNLDGAAVSQLQQELRRTYSSPRNGKADAAKIGEAYGRFFEKLLGGVPEFNISRLKVETSMGKADGSLHVRLLSHESTGPATPARVLPYVDAEAEMTVDESLVTGLARMALERKGDKGQNGTVDYDGQARMLVGAQIDAMEARSLVVRDGGVLRSKARLQNGKLAVNGQEIPLF